MKKAILMLIAAVIAVSPLMAGNEKEATGASLYAASDDKPAAKEKKAKKGPWDRKKYFSLGYSNQTLSPEYGNGFESKFGVSLVNGRNIFLHKKPIAKMLKFAIDLGSDINYAQYKDLEGDYDLPESEPGYEDEEDMDFGMHHIDIGLHVGPSISINPVDHLKLSVYFRFVPSYSMLILNSELYQSFTPLFTYGGEISYKVIGIGIEGRSGNAKYTDMLAQIEGAESMKIKYKTSALRFYISFRF